MNSSIPRVQAAGRAGLSALVLLLFFAATAGAATVTSSLMIPLNGSVYVQATAVPEWVDFTGRLHLVTQVELPGDACAPTDPCRNVRTRVHANLAEVSGVGRSSGATYRATGATRFATVVDVPGPLALQGGFRLHPPNPITPQGANLTVNINVALDESGQASEAAAPASLVSWWPGQGNALDAAGLNHGVAGEGVAYVEGRVGMAFSFDTTDYVTVPANESLEPAEVSVLAWVRADVAPAPFAYVLSKGANGCAAASYALYTGGNQGLQFYIADGVHADLSPDAGERIWDGEWHHVVGTYDRTAVRLYVDGEEVGFGTNALLADIGYDLEHGDLHLGAYVTGVACTFDFRFRGDVDEVQIYGRALSAEEISAIYGPRR